MLRMRVTARNNIIKLLPRYDVLFVVHYGELFGLRCPVLCCVAKLVVAPVGLGAALSVKAAGRTQTN